MQAKLSKKEIEFRRFRETEQLLAAVRDMAARYSQSKADAAALSFGRHEAWERAMRSSARRWNAFIRLSRALAEHSSK